MDTTNRFRYRSWLVAEVEVTMLGACAARSASACKPCADDHGQYSPQAYCDQKSFGGGWQMCYTTKHKPVHLSNESALVYNEATPYKTDGAFPTLGTRSDILRVPTRAIVTRLRVQLQTCGFQPITLHSSCGGPLHRQKHEEVPHLWRDVDRRRESLVHV